MSHVELVDVRRTYGTVVVLDHFSTSIAKGEFVSFLGPSGCGKTTTLRLVAGLDEPTSGRITVEGRVVCDPGQGVFVPPEARGLGMVFQSYALWPHLSVEANVAYPLAVRGRSRPDAVASARRFLALVHLEGLAARMPHELSGGQQQRVALARALVMEPSVLLLDEPLSNLDASLREQMRFEIKDIQTKLGITVIFVTHDQAEAFAMSDRILVMHRGRIVQEGTPSGIYARPANAFVAGFLGVANQARGRRDSRGQVVLDDVPQVAIAVEAPDAPHDGSGPLDVIVRPEAIDLAPSGSGGIPAVIERTTFLGDRIDYRARFGSTVWRISTPPPVRFGSGSAVELIVREGSAFAAAGTPLPS